MKIEKTKKKMTKQFRYIIYPLQVLMLLLVFVACNDDVTEQTERDVDFCVRATWQDGLSVGKTTRALTSTNILAGGTGDIVIDTDDYPVTIIVKCIKDGTQIGEDFTLTKGTGLCDDHNEYWQYTSNEYYKDKKIKRDELTFTATALIDGVDDDASDAAKDVLTGAFGFENIKDNHMLVTLHHTKALVRFAFKVSEKYDKVRYIKVTEVKLNNSECTIVEKVLNKDDMTYIAYAYIDPSVVTVSNENTLACTYNIYDKDAVFPTENMTSDQITAAESELLKHLTRKDVTAQNKFTLNSIKKADGKTTVSAIEAGYYYDLKVTLNPDYLYVLSEHDNKHLTIQ